MSPWLPPKPTLTLRLRQIEIAFEVHVFANVRQVDVQPDAKPVGEALVNRQL